MIYDPRPSLRTRLREYLGTDVIIRMENTMADWLTTLNGLVQQTTAASAAQATSFSNLQSAISKQTGDIAELRRLLEEAIANQGEVTPEMQALATQIGQSLDDMKKAAETADDGFEPAETPTDTAPVVEPDADGDVIPDETGRNNL